MKRSAASNKSSGKRTFFLNLKEYVRVHWRDVVLLAVFFACLPLMELFNHPIGTVHNIAVPLDDKIPLVVETVLVYNSWSPTIILLSIYFFFKEIALMRRYVITMELGQLMADFTFPFFQTKIPRPYETVFGGTDIFSRILASTYRVDNHYCGFPSIHIILCTLTIIFVWRSGKAPLWLKIFVTFYFTLIAITTLTTKQHVVLDVPGGVLYALVALVVALPLIRFYNRRFAVDAAENPRDVQPAP